MCRMLIASGKIDINLIIEGAILMAKDQNSVHELNKEKGLGSWTHGDGWGIAYLDENGEWQIKKSATAIYEDSAVKELKNIKTNLLILHTRKASAGGISYKNTHPFKAYEKNLGTVVFCHNGSIGDKIPFDSEYELVGETDSEKLFYSILTDLKKDTGRNIIESVIRKNLSSYKKLTGTNIIFSTKEKTIIAVRKNNFPKYFGMWLGISDERMNDKKTDNKMTIISSEKIKTLAGMSWKPIQQGDIISLTPGTLDISINKG